MMGFLDAWLGGTSLTGDSASRRLRLETLEPRRMLAGQEIDVYDDLGDGVLMGETVVLEDTSVGTPISSELTITNTGTDTLNIDTGSLVLPDGYSAQFGGSSALAAGESMTLTLTLTAAIEGTYAGEVAFGTNDADENPFVFQVTGGVSPAIVPEVTLYDELWAEIADGGQYDLGHDPWGTPLTAEFTVTNEGSDTLTLGALQGFTGEFTLVDQTNWGSLEPGESATFTVQFYTETEGQYQAELSFTTNDADEGVYNLTVQAYHGNLAPTAETMDDVIVNQDLDNVLVEQVYLWDSFEDAEDGDWMLYEVVYVETEYLFDSYDIDQSMGVLTLDFAPVVVGQSLVRIRATDSGGKWVEAVFNVEVIQVNINQQPQIIDFVGTFDAQTGLWVFTGRVLDEDPTGLLVTFGDLLAGYSVTTDDQGYFRLEVDLVAGGTASASTIDDDGDASDTVYYLI